MFGYGLDFVIGQDRELMDKPVPEPEIRRGKSMIMKCVLCKKVIESFGNNAAPIMEGRCCDKCNINVVIPARLKIFMKVKK